MEIQCIKNMNRQEIEDYLFCIQDYFQKCINKGMSVDSILDNTTILDEFEDYIPEEEYPIFVITVLNGFKSKDIINNILDSIEKKKVSLNVSN
tara:strand:+ start:751 stop:1029 length:279 start_codon:yes stop_codon:yes gene_type:complete